GSQATRGAVVLLGAPGIARVMAGGRLGQAAMMWARSGSPESSISRSLVNSLVSVSPDEAQVLVGEGSSEKECSGWDNGRPRSFVAPAGTLVPTQRDFLISPEQDSERHGLFGRFAVPPITLLPSPARHTP